MEIERNDLNNLNKEYEDMINKRYSLNKKMLNDIDHPCKLYEDTIAERLAMDTGNLDEYDKKWTCEKCIEK